MSVNVTVEDICKQLMRKCKEEGRENCEAEYKDCIQNPDKYL